MTPTWNYTAGDAEKGGYYLEVLEWIRYDKDGKAANLEEIRGQIMADSRLSGPYMLLWRLIPYMNEQGIALRVKQIIETIVPWLKQKQIVWFTDYPTEPGLVSVYPTDQTLQVRPGKAVIAVHWYLLRVALPLFLPTELCDYITQNAENSAHFTATVSPVF